MASHARLSPSSADRWMTCPGSVRLIERLTATGVIPADSSSLASSEGTAAHTVRSDCLELGLDPWDFYGTEVEADGLFFTVDEEMCAALQVGTDWIREQPGEMIVEHRVDLGRWLPRQFGTLDTAIIQRAARRLISFDLKYGKGLAVEATDIRQLRIYALGVVDNFDLYDAIDEILIVIDQPRLGGLKFWSVTIVELLAFGEELRAAGLAVEDPNAPLVFSEKGCGWCPVKDSAPGCPAYNDFIESLFDDGDGESVFAEVGSEPVFPDPAAMDPARRYHIVKHSGLATKWLANLHSNSIAAAEAGSPDPGSKIVAGQRGDRKWSDAEKAEALLVDALGDDAFTRKLKGPAPVEKDLKPARKKLGNPAAWEALTQLITQDEGRPILVSEDDDRPALTSIHDKFEDEQT